MADMFIGTMGFSYKDWDASFYPKGLPAGDYLGYYSGFFDAVEIDSTFYGIPPLHNIERWSAITPDGFRICAKTPKAITHEAGLVNVDKEMNAFLDVMRKLGSKLGVILIQFPPSFRAEQAELLAGFLEVLPKDVRFAVEFRNRSWYTPETVALLSTNSICWAATEYAQLPKKVEATTDFQYFRFIGQHRRFSSHDRVQMDVRTNLDWWHERILELPERVQEVYGFFNNDYSGHAPATALKFMELIGMPVAGMQPPQQGRLF
jgi:uncharacterized protein YecE (DUF72 family)